MYMPSHKTFKRALTWNALDAIFYQTLLALHYLALYHAMEQTAFGIVGTLFSFLFIAATLINAGLESALAPLVTRISACKSTCTYFLRKQVLPGYAVCASLSLLFFVAVHRFFMLPCSIWLTVLVCVCSIAEALRRLLYTFLQLQLRNRETAAVQMTSIVVYIMLVWSTYRVYGTLQPTHLFGYFLLTTILSVVLLLRHCARWYTLLPHNTNDQPQNFATVRLRCYGLIHQIYLLLFSGNVLIPLIALHSGFALAGIFKLTAMLLHSASSTIRHMFGYTSAALFSKLKTGTDQEKLDLFGILSQQLYQLIGCLLLLCGVSILGIRLLYNETADTCVALLIFSFLLCLQNSCLLYEQFLFVHEKLDLFIALTISTAVCMIGTIVVLAPRITLATLLLTLLVLRIMHFAAIVRITYTRWRLVPFHKKPA